MSHTPYASNTRGMGLIDVIIGIALMLLVFGALFGVLRVSISLATLAKSKTTALEIANRNMEHLRSLPYTALGTVGDTPSGAIPAHTQVTENGGTYTVDTAIVYTDDPADGTGPADTNGIAADYKTASIRVGFSANGRPDSIELASTFVPTGVETAP